MPNSLRKGEEEKIKGDGGFWFFKKQKHFIYINNLTYKLKNLFPYIGYAAIFHFLKVHDIQTPGLTAEERQNRKKQALTFCI